MINIGLKYNPYTFECEVNDETQVCNEFIESKKGVELSEWVKEFIEHIVVAFNDDVTVEFEGIERDCDVLEDAVDEYNENSLHKVTLHKKLIAEKNSEEMQNRVEKLRGFYNELKSDSCPFDQFKTDENIEISFNKALDAEFEIAVVATMSSGKSTLINAMIGNEILPARNEATTATIARIHDEDGKDHFSCKSYDKEDNELQSFDHLELDSMNIINDDPNTSSIEIYGDIIGINSTGLQLVLTDTPGPNNSRDSGHKSHTYSLIQDSKYKPMILYILNGTQLETNDDNTLLTDIADAMKQGGRQASDRFIFVLNKADEFDTEKESIQSNIEKTKNYLEGHGIKNPKIFPCSARLAKLIRQHQAGYELSPKERRDLNGDLSYFIEEEKLHFSDVAPASNYVRGKIESALNTAKMNKDQYAEALIYSGIPVVEAVICEYLEKYALPMKISEAINSFIQIIRDSETEAREMSSLNDNQKKVEETKQAIKKIQTLIADGEKGTELKSKIQALSVDEEIKNAFENLRGTKIGKFIETERKKYGSNKVRENEVAKSIQNIQEDLQDLENKFAVDIQNIINDKIGSEAQKYADEYNKYVTDLLGEAFGHEVKAASILGNLANITLSADDADDFSYNEKEVVGYHYETEYETRTVRENVKRQGKREKTSGPLGGRGARFFGKIFHTDWGYEAYEYDEEVPVEREYEVQKKVADYEKVKYVDMSRMFNAKVIPLLDNLTTEAKKLAAEKAKDEETNLKEAFYKSFDMLEQKIAEKLDEKEKSIQDEKALENLVEESKMKLAWLKDFNERLNSALL